jgi:hypothetical protein
MRSNISPKIQMKSVVLEQFFRVGGNRRSGEFPHDCRHQQGPEVAMATVSSA